MKSLKYIIISILIVTICKKATPSDVNKIDNQATVTTETLDNQFSLIEPDKKHKNRHSDRDKQHKKRYRSTVKSYNNDTKIARIDNLYVGVYEYTKAVTPPNITIPAMVPFGTITEKQSKKKEALTGKKLQITTLWGIPVYGHRKPIKESEKNLTIGYLWLNQDLIFGIAQMTDGKTFVGVIDDHQPNYIDTGKHHLGKTGPVWTWYSEEDFQDLQEKYGIEKPSSSNVKEIGVAKINRQRYKLYGIELPNLDLITPSINTWTNNSFTTKPETFNNLNSPKKFSFNSLYSNQETASEIHPLILSLLSKNWLNKENNN